VRVPGDEHMTLVLPTESQDNQAVYGYLQEIVEQENSIGAIEFVDVRQSMQNGGGPACLRLRVALTDVELAAVNSQFLVHEQRIEALSTWVERHYRDELSAADLADPQLAQESFMALDELTQIFELDSFYEFQQ